MNIHYHPPGIHVNTSIKQPGLSKIIFRFPAVASYFNSVDHKDSVTFCNLFALDSVCFFGVNAPETYQAYLKKNPNAQLMFKDNYKSFIHFIVSSNKKAEEKYDNLDIINIWNDNTVATISFNYSFWKKVFSCSASPKFTSSIYL